MTPLPFHLYLHCCNVRLSWRQTVPIWCLTFLHKSCCTDLIIICAWILSSPSLCASYDLPRETRKFKAHQLGQSGGNASSSHGSLPQHPCALSHPFLLLLMSLVLPVNLDFLPGFSSLNCLSFHFSLSHFLISPICCLESFVQSCKMSLFSGTGAQLCVSPSLGGHSTYLPLLWISGTQIWCHQAL